MPNSWFAGTPASPEEPGVCDDLADAMIQKAYLARAAIRTMIARGRKDATTDSERHYVAGRALRLTKLLAKTVGDALALDDTQRDADSLRRRAGELGSRLK